MDSLSKVFGFLLGSFLCCASESTLYFAINAINEENKENSNRCQAHSQRNLGNISGKSISGNFEILYVQNQEMDMAEQSHLQEKIKGKKPASYPQICFVQDNRFWPKSTTCSKNTLSKSPYSSIRTILRKTLFTQTLLIFRYCYIFQFQFVLLLPTVARKSFNPIVVLQPSEIKYIQAIG